LLKDFSLKGHGFEKKYFNLGCDQSITCDQLQQRLDEEFQKKLERNKMIAEEQTAKRRRKR